MPCRGLEPLEFIERDLLKKLESEIALGKVDNALWTCEDILRQHHKKVVEENNNLTKWICTIMDAYNEDGYNVGGTVESMLESKDPNFKNWWERHLELDRRREEVKAKNAEELRIKQEALSKLTEEEKKILKIR